MFKNSWEACRRSATQESPGVLCDLKMYERAHQILPLARTRSPVSQVHFLFLESHLNAVFLRLCLPLSHLHVFR
jgi:hypothetical protein